jgi:prolyl oligopeptidase
MHSVSRRTLLTSTAAGIVAAQLPRPAAASTDGPPVAPVRPVTENYFGTSVTDRYRWMEAEGPEWLAYAKAQGAYTASVLDKIPGREALAAAIGKNTGAVVSVIAVQTGGAKIFSEVRPAGANTSKLFVRDGMTGADRKLVDPDIFAATGTHDSLDWWLCSPDGSHVVLGISAGGGEQSVLHVLETETGKMLPETIDRTADAGPSWLPDGSGFFYNRLQDVPQNSVEYEEDSVCWLHKLGTPVAQDIKVMGKGLSPVVTMSDIDFPNVNATSGSDIAIGASVSGVQNELALYAASLAKTVAGQPDWQPICVPADDVTGAAVHGSDIYLLTHKNASRYRIVKSTAAKPAFADAVEIVPQSSGVIRNIVAARDAIYILQLDAGLAGVRRLAPDGTITTIKLPFAGSIFQETFYADTLHDGVWFSLQGWVQPSVICYATAAGVVQTDIAPKPPIDVSPYASEEVFATARDGVKVPLSIVYRKGVARNAPLLMEAYGAYGITIDPAFLGRWLPFLDLGGVFAVAHVRGGGELGEDWHLAGQKLKKFNTWRDTIDCAQYLINTHWTSHKHLAVIGGSAGGITVGRLLTERPDLAAVVIDQVGVSDAMRSEFSPNGPPNIPEFGTVKDPEGFKGLYAMDAYQHVRDGVKYPSILLTTGLHDPRVSSWEPTKMTARLQAATGSKNPVLLRVDADAGHGIGSTRTQRDIETADVIAFILWRTGDPRFQPPAKA